MSPGPAYLGGRALGRARGACLAVNVGVDFGLPVLQGLREVRACHRGSASLPACPTPAWDPQSRLPSTLTPSPKLQPL